MRRAIILSLVCFLAVSSVSCALLQNLDERVERFLARLAELVEGWEAGGLLPPLLAERMRAAVEDARDDWRAGKARLLQTLEEALAWLAGRTADLNLLDAALEDACADGILSRSEVVYLQSKRR